MDLGAIGGLAVRTGAWLDAFITMNRAIPDARWECEYRLMRWTTYKCRLDDLAGQGRITMLYPHAGLGSGGSMH